MKKNRMLRLASALLILTLLTTSVIGGTFAKYVSTGSVSDTARVAKWGVEIKTSGTLYSDAYAKKDAEDNKGNLPAGWEEEKITDKDITVASVSTAMDNIVAPGTKSYGKGLSFAISGTPEVAVNVSAKITAEDIFLAKGKYGVLEPATVSDDYSLAKAVKDYTTGVYALKDGTYTKQDSNSMYDTVNTYYILTNVVDLTNDYFPVEYTLKGTTSTTNATNAVGIAQALAGVIKTDANKTETKGINDTVYKVEYSKENLNQDFAANVNLATEGPKFGDEELIWEWKFDETDNTTRDSADTILGDLMAMKKDSASVKCKIVAINADTLAELVLSTDANDYTVKNGNTDEAKVVANLNTSFDIELTATQVD